MVSTFDGAAAPVSFEITPDVTLTRTLGESWRYRELLAFLVWRDLKVRYRQTVLGVLWALLQPVALMAAFSLFVGRVVQMPSGVPYPVFVLCGLLPWQLFAHALAESSNSVLANERLITKIYFPRVIIPAAATAAGLVDFAIALPILFVVMWWHGVYPVAALVFAPLFVAQAMVAGLGAGLWLAALNVQYRDVRYVLSFLVQLWLFVTPVIYPSSVVPQRWRALYAINPVVGAVEGFRWAIIGSAPPDAGVLAVSAAAAVLLAVTGLMYFARMEADFADVI
jgi:lipopolysaccharide transport system permease protein